MHHSRIACFKKHRENKGKQSKEQQIPNLTSVCMKHGIHITSQKEYWRKKFTIEKKDWNNDTPVLYEKGQGVAGKPRGNSITGKRARKKVKYSDDGQEEEEEEEEVEEEEETNQYYQDSTEDDLQTRKPCRAIQLRTKELSKDRPWIVRRTHNHESKMIHQVM
jgi:hypothetical protein